MREPGIDNKQAFGWKSMDDRFTWKSTIQVLDVLIRIERRTYLDVSATFILRMGWYYGPRWRLYVANSYSSNTISSQFFCRAAGVFGASVRTRFVACGSHYLHRQRYSLKASLEIAHWQPGALVNESTIPYGFFSFPIDKEALFDRPTEDHFSKVITILQLG